MRNGKTKVIFRKWGNGDVIAMFPEIGCDHLGFYCQSYMHVGQHSAASPNLVQSTKPAKEEDYKHLLKELTDIGYDLKIVKKFNYAMQQKRMKQNK